MGRLGHVETLYRLPTYTHSAAQSLLVGCATLLLVDAVDGLLLASSFVARRWGFASSLGAPLVCFAAYPQRQVLALAIGAAGVFGALLFFRAARSAAALAVPLLVPLYLVSLRPVYPPLSLVRWSLRYQHQLPLAADLRHANALFLGTFAALSGLTIATVLVRLQGLRESGDTHGSSHWATRAEIRRTGLLGTSGGIVVGAWRSGRRRLHRLCDRRDRHVLAFAPSGSGKSTSLIIPTLFEWPSSAVVFDVKGELWHLTSGWRQSQRHLCIRFDPSSTDGTAARYNPLLVIPRGPEEVKYAQGVADVLVDPQGRDQPRTFWEQSAHALLVASILHVLYAAEHKSLAGCAHLLSNPARPIRQTLDAMLHTHHDPDLEMGWRDTTGRKTPVHPVVAAGARALLDMDPRTASGVVATAQSHLDLFRDPILAANTSQSDFVALDLVEGDHPVSLYITVPPAELDRVRGLLRIVLNQLCRSLTEHLDFEPASSRPRSRRPLLLVLDEFPVLGKLDFFGRAMAYLRGYGIRVFLSIQSLAQLYDIYGQHQSITANCALQVAFAPADVETAELLSKMTGPMTVNVYKRSLSGGPAAVTPRRSTVSHQELARPLLTAEEVRRLPEDEALVFAAGHPPIRARRCPYFLDRQLVEQARIAPPPKSDRVEHGAGAWSTVSGSEDGAPQPLHEVATQEVERILDLRRLSIPPSPPHPQGGLKNAQDPQ